MSNDINTAIENLIPKDQPQGELLDNTIDIVIQEPTENDSPEGSFNEESYDAPAQEQAPRRSSRKPQTANKRIAQITYEKKVLEAQVFQQQHFIEEQRRAFEEQQNNLARIAYDREQDALLQRENNLKNQILLAETVIADATKEEDIERAVKAQSLMSQFTSDLSILKEKKRNPTYPQEAYIPQQPQPQYQPDFYQQPPEPVYNPEFDDWRERNSWYGNDPRLTQEADALGEELRGRYAYNNMGHLIGQGEFLQALDQQLSGKYGLNQSQSSSRPKYNYQERAVPVAPINRQGNYPSSPQGTSNAPRHQTVLDPQREAIIANWPMRLYGRPATMEEKRQIYAMGDRNVTNGLTPTGNQILHPGRRGH